MNNRLSTASNSSITSFNKRQPTAKITQFSAINQNDALLERINQFEARIKAFEDNNNLLARISTLEAAYNDLQSQNTELKLSIERLTCDIERVQFLIEQSLNDKEVDITEFKTTVTELTSDIQAIKSEIDRHNEQFQESHSLAEKGISFEQQKLNTNLIMRCGIKKHCFETGYSWNL